MKKLVETDPWKIIVRGWDPERQREAESLCSIGNGRMGQRANFEETYSGDSLQGNYIAGVYYPDKTRVGWWKNGYPEYFAKVLNAPSWIGIQVQVDGQELDLSSCSVSEFEQSLDMKNGLLQRQFTAILANGQTLAVKSTRFCSRAESETAWIKYQIEPINFSGKIQVVSAVNGDVRNEDSNYDEVFWEPKGAHADAEWAWVHSITKKTAFEVCTAMRTAVVQGDQFIELSITPQQSETKAAQQFEVAVTQGETTTIYKAVAVTSSMNHAVADLRKAAGDLLAKSWEEGFEAAQTAHQKIWAKTWDFSDVLIEGDVEAQQAIRYNIFQLYQTYTGEDERLNIGPKGFTGEKYGGSTYWDTEAYCLPFFLSTAQPKVARQLLIYRYKHLDKAIENAAKLGFTDGAALYPMVTMNGEECHNEWEITFEEIHRNGAIAYAIYNYIRHTNDKGYLAEYGFEVLLGLARFWRQRVSFSERKQKYVILGVTGPNEYENNVNNNWYTNLMATWTMEYTLDAADYLQDEHPERYKELVQKTNFDDIREPEEWTDIIENMYYPKLKGTRILLQQQGYMDKDQVLVRDLKPEERPINQHWSWDRILRSCFIKQADVLQGMYLFEDRFDKKTLRDNFEFYEPRTVHESSLSPSVHAVLAARLGMEEKAYEMYLRTARLDLDDYNNEVDEGLHITSMAGSWLAIVQGFGGMQIRKGKLQLNPFLPKHWKSYAFNLLFRGRQLRVQVKEHSVRVSNMSEKALDLTICGKKTRLEAASKVTIETAVPA